jgi:hypothetical protein
MYPIWNQTKKKLRYRHKETFSFEGGRERENTSSFSSILGIGNNSSILGTGNNSLILGIGNMVDKLPLRK